MHAYAARATLLDHSHADSVPSSVWPALAAAAWLLLGTFTLTLTPLPAHTPTLGWSPAFWLCIAPACIIAALRLRSAAGSGGSAAE